MAKATRLGERPAPVILELSNKEADALYSICQAIGGHPDGPRGVFSSQEDSLSSILYAVGAQEIHPKNGSIYFTEDRVKAKKWREE